MNDDAGVPATSTAIQNPLIVDITSGFVSRPSEIVGFDTGYNSNYHYNHTSHSYITASVNPNQPILYDLTTTAFNMAYCHGPGGIVGLLLVGLLL